MEQVILTGSGTITDSLESLIGYGYLIKSIEIDLPMDEVGTTDPNVTLSGSYTGSFNFRGDTTLDLKFEAGETVNITAMGFYNNYSAIIRYVKYETGDKRTTTMANSGFGKIPVPWRFRSDAWPSGSGLYSM